MASKVPKVKIPSRPSSGAQTKLKGSKEPVDEWVSRMAKKYSEADLEKLQSKYPKSVQRIRLTQLQERHMDPDQFAVRMAKLRQPPAPTKTPKELQSPQGTVEM